MGLHEYLVSQEIEKKDYPLYALVMVLARKASPENFEKIKRAFPHTVAELEKRYHAPSGLLPEDLRGRAKLKAKGDRVEDIEGRLGIFDHPLIRGTYFLPDGSDQIVLVTDRSLLEVLF